MMSCFIGNCLELCEVQDGGEGDVGSMKGEELDAEDLVHGDVEEHGLFIECCGNPRQRPGPMSRWVGL